MTPPDRRRADSEEVRVRAPLDDPLLNLDPLVVDGRHSGARLERVTREGGTLVEGQPGEEVRSRVVRLGTGDATATEVLVDGWSVLVEVESERRAALRDRARRGSARAGLGGPIEVRAIIPGRILSVSVVPGDAVVAGQQLLVVEAMKMQNELRAPRDGTIERVLVTAGGTIELGDVLLVIA